MINIASARKSLLCAIVLISSLVAMGQRPLTPDSFHYYIRLLDNSKVTYSSGGTAGARLDPHAQALYHHADKFLIDTLIDLLADSNKVVAINILLSQLLEPANKNIFHTSEDLTDSIRVEYRFNGLTWKRVYDKINLTETTQTDSSGMKKIQGYWRQKKNEHQAN